MVSFLSEAVISDESCVTVNRPISEVFRFVAEDFVENCPSWSPEVVAIVLLTDPPLSTGSLMLQCRSDRFGKQESKMIVSEMQKNVQFSYAGATDSYSGDFTFECLEKGNRTKLTFLFRLENVEVVMRPFAKLIRTAIREGVMQSTENIQKILEDENTARL